MKTKFEYMFGGLSERKFRHWPVLYLANGRDGFCLCILGLHMTVKWGKDHQDKENGITE
jgi:hypothetical protein